MSRLAPYLIAGLLLGGILLAQDAEKPPPRKVVPDVLHTPAEGVIDSYDDARALEALYQKSHDPRDDPRNNRWLSAYNETTAGDLQVAWEQATVTANFLNFTKSSRVQLVKINGGRTLRVPLYDLGIDPHVWDSLGLKGSGQDPEPEPWFNEVLEQIENEIDTVSVEKVRTVWRVWPGGKDSEGTEFPAGYRYQAQEKYTEEVERKNPKAGEKTRIQVPSRGVDKRKAIELRLLADAKLVPVYRVDWFVTFAMQPPWYIEAQGNPKTLDDYERLAGVYADRHDEQGKRIPKKKWRQGASLRGAALFSEVASANRILERSPSKFNRGRGYFGQSYDFLSSRRAKDVYRNALLDDPDASEIIFTLPNGLEGFGLVAKKLVAGKNVQAVIEFADPRVALDRRTYLHDRIVWTGWKCRHCHTEGNIKVADELRLTAVNDKGYSQLGKEEQEEVKDLYFDDDINLLFAQDRANYGAVIRSLAGKAAATVNLEFQALQARYMDGKLGLEDVCIETGYPMKAVKPIIEEAGRVGLDPSFVRLLKGRNARRDQFEVAYPQIVPYLVAVPRKEE